MELAISWKHNLRDGLSSTRTFNKNLTRDEAQVLTRKTGWLSATDQAARA